MSGIAASNVGDRLKIGFAIGAGCLLGAPKTEATMCVCELLLAGAYNRQYDFAKYLFDDLDLSVANDLQRRYSKFYLAVIETRKRCNNIFNDLKFYFEDCDINHGNLRAFITKAYREKSNGIKVTGKDKILELFIAINECLIHFETCAQILGMFSNDCTKHVEQMENLTDHHFDVLIPMLNLFIDGYQLIDYPLDINYNKLTLELEIVMPNRYSVGSRAISYRSLIRCLENIEPYRRRNLRITLSNVAFDEMHYDCILNLANILRKMDVISDLHVNFETQNVWLGNNQPWFRSVIIKRILSMTNTIEINFPDVSWWRSYFDKDIRAVKLLEENALYSPLLPVFKCLDPKRREKNLKLLDDQSQEPAVNKLLHNNVIKIIKTLK